MSSLFPILFILVATVVVITVLGKAKKGRLAPDIYRPASELFSAAERAFLVALEQALDSGHRAFGKVRLADLVAIKPGLHPKARQIALNRIAQKHVDFVVCDKQTLAPVCIVELNDSSHNSKKAKTRDELLAQVCAQVGLPLLTVKAAKSYPQEALRQQIANAIAPSETRIANVA